MKHLKGFRKLNRTASHRKALFSNMAVALFKNERIKTTVQKAKELRRVVEKIITRAKVKNLHNIRLIAKTIKDKAILSKIFDEIAPRYIERLGGYTRIIKLDRRQGDGAQMAFIEFVEEQFEKKKKKKKIKTKVTVKEEIKKEENKDETVPVENKDDSVDDGSDNSEENKKEETNTNDSETVNDKEDGKKDE